MNNLFLVVSKGSEDISRQIQNTPKFDYSNAFKDVKPYQFKYIPSQSTINFAHNIIYDIDMFCIIMIVISMFIIALSVSNSNHNWRSIGFSFAKLGYIGIVLGHLGVASAMSYHNFFHRLIPIAFFVGSQIMLYMVPTVLYVQGIQALEMDDIVPSLDAKNKAYDSFKYLIFSVIFAGILMTLSGGISR